MTRILRNFHNSSYSAVIYVCHLDFSMDDMIDSAWEENNNNNRPIIFSNESGCVSLCDSWQTSGRSIFLYREPACVVWVIYYYESIDVRLYRCAGQNKKRKQMRKDIENIPSRSRHCISSFLNYRYYIFPYRKWFKNLLIGNSASD